LLAAMSIVDKPRREAISVSRQFGHPVLAALYSCKKS